jgi:predicted Zn-ribbon and HTH transcriptional regulator
MNYYRLTDDGPNPTKVFYPACRDCNWTGDENYGSEDEIPMPNECPECKSNDLTIESETV